MKARASKAMAAVAGAKATVTAKVLRWRQLDPLLAGKIFISTTDLLRRRKSPGLTNPTKCDVE